MRAHLSDAPALTHHAVQYVQSALRMFSLTTHRGPHPIMDLRTYLDASGGQGGDHPARSLTIGGFIGRVDEWPAFTDEWTQALAEFHVDYWHMRKFAHKRPPFDWPEPMRRDRLGRMVDIARRHVIASVGCSLDLVAFDATFKEPALRAKVGGPYGLVAQNILQTAALVALGIPDVSPPYLMTLVLEKGDNGQGKVVDAFNANWGTPGMNDVLNLGTLTLEDKRLFPPLQAADIVAYELYREYDRDRAHPQRWAMSQLRGPIPYSHHRMGPVAIQVAYEAASAKASNR